MFCVVLILFASCVILTRGGGHLISPASQEINNSALSHNTTTSVNGIFVFLVFLAHFSGYFENLNEIDKPYFIFRNLMGQGVVTTFLFYSGFGMAHGLLMDKNAYLKKLCTKRFWGLLIRFDLCVILYHLLAFAMSKKIPDVPFVLKTFIAWSSAGNSNWYIFYMLLAYVGIFLCFKIFNSNKIALIAFFIFAIVYSVVISFFKKDESCWITTSLVLPFGMFWAFNKEKIENILKKHYIVIFITNIAIIAICFAIKYFLQFTFGFFFNIIAISEMIFIVLLTYKIEFKSQLLLFLGKVIFPVYILQRLAFNFFNQFSLPIPIYFAVSALTTAAVVFVYELVSLLVVKLMFFCNKKIKVNQ